MTNQKFEITGIAHEEYPFLHRIRALRDVGKDVKAGRSEEHTSELQSQR